MLKFYAFMQNSLADRLSGDRGATAVEYGLIVTLIAVAIIAIVFTVGQNLKNEFTTVANNL